MTQTTIVEKCRFYNFEFGQIQCLEMKFGEKGDQTCWFRGQSRGFRKLFLPRFLLFAPSLTVLLRSLRWCLPLSKIHAFASRGAPGEPAGAAGLCLLLLLSCKAGGAVGRGRMEEGKEVHDSSDAAALRRATACGGGGVAATARGGR